MRNRTEDIVRAIHILAESINRERVNLMEVCGTHTMSLFRNGIRDLLPESVVMLSGPGCPVCVTPSGYIDAAIELARNGYTIVTFGDMFRVPGSESSLERERAGGCDIRVVYSPAEALGIAKRNPTRNVVFLSVGFETTAPVMAATLKQAREDSLDNFTILCGNKLIPPAMRALLEQGEAKIDGFMCPGHVSVMIGCAPYEPIVREYGRPCVITGFDAEDILMGIFMLLAQMREGRAEVEIQYVQCVKPEGNPKARAEVEEVFEECDSLWRGLGEIPASGLALRGKYRYFDAEQRTGVRVTSGEEPRGCRCGDVLRGIVVPTDCPLFGEVCRPESPVGPCMVSSEGTCAAYFKYGGKS